MNTIQKCCTLAAAAAAFGLANLTAHAAMSLIDPALTGTADFDQWSNASLTTPSNPGFPGFPGSGAWPAPISSSSGGDAGLDKISGSAYPSSGSIYFGGFAPTVNYEGAHLQIADTTPVADLANVVVQVQFGEAYGYDFYNHTLPALTYTTSSGSTTVTGEAAAQHGLLEQVQNGTFPDPTSGEDEPVYINTWLIQWDLSGVSEPILDVAIDFTGVQHSQLYQLRLDQSDAYQDVNVTFVPEPASIGLLAVGGLALLRRRQGA